MSDLTREEIRNACEAVGWKWDKDDIFGWVARQEPSLTDPEAVNRLWFPEGDYSDDNATALLDATGLEWVIGRIRSNIIAHPYWAEVLDDHPDLKQFGIDLPTAAVRAVNAWSKTRLENP